MREEVTVVPSKPFELEQVLKYRTEIERVRTQEFAAARHDYEHANEQLKLEEARMQDLSSEFRSRQEKLGSIDDIRMYAHFFTRKRNDINNQREQTDLLGGVMTERRTTLLNAAKDKKILESLKEKKTKEFRLMMNQKEQSFMDEISVQKKGTLA